MAIRAIIAVAFGIVAAACAQETRAQAGGDKWELADAFPAFTPSTCVAPNPRERSLLDIAASAIEQVGEDNANWLDIGAQKYLARHQFRTEGNRRVAVCTSQDILGRVAAAFESRKGFGKGRLVEYQLELAARLPTRSKYIVEAVGKSAFSPAVQESDTFRRRDIRPFARTVLASFGPEARAFQILAYEQMSALNSMGTGAAQ